MTTTERRIAALERIPKFQDPERMPLCELLERVARLVGDPAAAQRLRASAPGDALNVARELMVKLNGFEG